MFYLFRQLVPLSLKSFLLWLAVASATNAEWHNAHQDIMGTRVSVELWHENTELAAQAMDSVMNEMRVVDQTMSPYIATSDIFRINQQAAQQEVIVSEEVYKVIDKSLYYSRLSDGAFDISFSSVGRYYDYRQKLAPSERKVQQKLAAIDYQLIKLNPINHSVRFLHTDINIDLGGIAKGYAVDRAIKLLQDLGVKSAIVSAGGDSRILGDRQGTPWVIGIRHPRKAGDYAVRIPLINSAISTSGDYERFFIRDGERLHHIINPSTGHSANKVQSVSILAPHAVDSDALSTTVFIMGIKAGLTLINSLDGIDAIIIDADGRLHYSEGLLRTEQKG
jgi:thiamine biosynthesis lipoprotein